eukprot:scaffold7897_cov248-Pinguiococcus_pyrenoidosus.AAC.8
MDAAGLVLSGGLLGIRIPFLRKVPSMSLEEVRLPCAGVSFPARCSRSSAGFRRAPGLAWPRLGATSNSFSRGLTSAASLEVVISRGLTWDLDLVSELDEPPRVFQGPATPTSLTLLRLRASAEAPYLFREGGSAECRRTPKLRGTTALDRRSLVRCRAAL